MLINGLADDHSESVEELKTAEATFEHDVARFEEMAEKISDAKQSLRQDNDSLKTFVVRMEPLADGRRDLIRQVVCLYKLLSRLAESTKKNGRMSPLKPLEEARSETTEHLISPYYFWRQERLLQGRFPEAEPRDVEGLVKLVGHNELASNDWSLTPGRYVGVAPDMEDEGFDFKETILGIHTELNELNVDAVRLAAMIKRNFEELKI